MKKLLFLLLCLVLCTALVPAALADECTCQVHWAADYCGLEDHENATGGGTMEEAIQAAMNNPNSNYITTLIDLADAAYTISSGNITIDFSNANVTAAAGKSAFTATGSAEVNFNNYYSYDYSNSKNYFQGSEACITVDSSSASVTVEVSSLFLAAADNHPAIRLLDGTLDFRVADFDNANASCDIEYTAGKLDLNISQNPAGLIIQNKGRTLQVDSEDFRNAIFLKPDYYLVESGKTEPAVLFETGKTYFVYGPLQVTFDYGFNTTRVTQTVYPGMFTVPECSLPHPEAAYGKEFSHWVYQDRTVSHEINAGEKIELQTDSTFIAYWKDTIPTAHFLAGFGDGIPVSVNCADGRITLPDQESFTHPDPAMKLIGWRYYDGNMIGHVAYPNDIVSLKGDMNFIAIWDDGIHELSFMPGNGELPYTVVATSSTYAMPPAPASNDGRVFIGWMLPLSQDLLPAGYLFPVMEDASFIGQWTYPVVRVSSNGTDHELKNGEYLSSNGMVSLTRPSGGYAHYANGVLTLHNFKGRRIYTEGIPLTIVLEGSNLLECDDASLKGMWANLIIKGDGSLNLLADRGDGIVLDESSLDIQGGSITIQAFDDGIDSESGEKHSLVKISGGSLTINAEDSSGIETDSKVDLLITGGEITINAKEYGLDPDGAVTSISGGKLNITAGEIGIDAGSNLVITGGEITIFAEEFGIAGLYSALISGGDLHVAATNPDGWAVRTRDDLVINGMKLPEDATIGKVTNKDDIEFWTLLANGKPVSVVWMYKPSTPPPSTGDSTPLALLAVLTALSACAVLMLRRRRA